MLLVFNTSVWSSLNYTERITLWMEGLKMNKKQVKYVHWLDRPGVYILVLYLFLRQLLRPAIIHISEFIITLFSSQSFYLLKMQNWSATYAAYINAIEQKSVCVIKMLYQSLVFNYSKLRPGISPVLGHLQETHGFFHMCSLCVNLFGSSLHIWLKSLTSVFFSI